MRMPRPSAWLLSCVVAISGCACPPSTPPSVLEVHPPRLPPPPADVMVPREPSFRDRLLRLFYASPPKLIP